MPEDGHLGSNGTEGASATRVGPARWPSAARDRAARPRPRRSRDWAPWLIAASVFAVYTAISLFRYFQLNPSSWDLGIFTELVKQYAHLHAPVADVRGSGFNLMGDHFSPVVALIAPFFLLVLSPGTLLVAQAFLTAVSVLPVTRAAGEKLGRRAGLAVGAAYGFSWGLQQMVNFDFHEIAFAVPLLAFSMSALVRGRYRATVLWALPLVLVKEDQGFTVAAIGLLMIIVTQWRDRSGRGVLADRRAVFGGQFLIVWGIVWSVVAIAVIIPHFNAAHHYQYWSDGGALSPGANFSPGAATHQLFTSWPVKLQTTLMILLPTAFIALWSPLALAALPSILLRFLGTNSNYWSTDWHYNATVMPIVFIAAVDAISRIRAGRQARARLALASAAETVLTPPGGPAAGLPDGVRLPEGNGRADGAGGPDGGEPENGAGAKASARSVNGSLPTGTGDLGHGAATVTGDWRGRPGWIETLRTATDQHGAAAMLAIALALIFQFPVSNLWNPLTYRIDQHDADARTAMARVPDGATVTTTLDLLAPLAARTDTFWIGNTGNPNTEYIVFDGANSGYSPPPSNVPAFVAGQHPGVTYRVIYQGSDVYVFRLAGR